MVIGVILHTVHSNLTLAAGHVPFDSASPTESVRAKGVFESTLSNQVYIYVLIESMEHTREKYQHRQVVGVRGFYGDIHQL